MVTLAITTYNRLDMLIESFEKILNDERITQIVISDDHSDPDIVKKVKLICDSIPKVKFNWNDKNYGVYMNKFISVALADNPWVIVFDSDNIISPAYLDALYKFYPWDPHTLYNPDFGLTEFNYTNFAGQTITRENVANYLGRRQFDCLINAMNCFVNREEYLKHFDAEVEPIAADSIYKNYLWLKGGNKIFVVPGMRYVHRIHAGSHYVNNCAKSTEFHRSVMEKLKSLK